MNILKAAAVATLLVSTIAGATGVPVDFAKWARATLNSKGMPDARVVQTAYPFYFTFCEKDSTTLWRYDVMSQAQIKEAQQGKIMTPVNEDKRTVQVETESAACMSAS